MRILNTYFMTVSSWIATPYWDTFEWHKPAARGSQDLQLFKGSHLPDFWRFSESKPLYCCSTYHGLTVDSMSTQKSFATFLANQRYVSNRVGRLLPNWLPRSEQSRSTLKNFIQYVHHTCRRTSKMFHKKVYRRLYQSRCLDTSTKWCTRTVERVASVA